MTITSYSTLQTTLADWIKRGDMTSRIPLFISMAESAMNARLRMREMEYSDSLTLESGNNYVALPSRFIEPISLVFSAGGDLCQMDRESIYRKQYDNTGKPTYYSIGGSNIDFDSTADADYGMTLRYFRKLDLAADLSNAVLLAAPFSYLYGSLQAFARWTEDGEQLAQYTAMFQQELRQLEELDRASRGTATLRTELPMLHDWSYNITTG